MKQSKRYLAPACEIVTVQSADVLTMSLQEKGNVNDLNQYSADEWIFTK